jgi:hypothetical protein
MVLTERFHPTSMKVSVLARAVVTPWLSVASIVWLWSIVYGFSGMLDEIAVQRSVSAGQRSEFILSPKQAFLILRRRSISI